MKTKNIFKVLAFAILVLALLLNTACNSEIINNENNDGKGYALPVTVNVTRQGDDPATKATYNDETKKLAFSTGDKLFVAGSESTAGQFAGTLDCVSEGTFSGTIYTKNEWTGTFDELFSAASVTAILLPKGYESYHYLSINNNNTEAKYDDYVRTNDDEYTLATSKAAGVEQFSYESAKTYSSGFARSPENAILNFTITGLKDRANAVTLKDGNRTMFRGSVTPSSGTAVFALGARIKGYNDRPVDLKNLTLTVDGTDIAITSTSKNLEAGRIYNITRNATLVVDLSKLTVNYIAQNGETLTGTLGANVKISIADGATVTLDGVTINGENDVDYRWAGITCLGDATIILSGANTVKGFYENYPAVFVPSGKTLTIQGTGSLNASSNGYGAGVGGSYSDNCGNIRIDGGTITAVGGQYSAGIGGGRAGGCGTITITDGSITATGGYFSAGIGAVTCGKITITGGTIIANGSQYGAGIGCSKDGSCTDGIEISGTANVTAQGGDNAAGIGSGHGNTGDSNCGDITIGGTATVSATGGKNGAGIGSGRGIENNYWKSNCGNITISKTVTKVTATKGSDAANSIGKGDSTFSTCGIVTIGDVEGAISTSPYTFPAS